MDMKQHADQVVRVMTVDHAFRVVVATTAASTAEVVRLQGLAGQPAEPLAGLVTGAALLRETMAPNLRVQAVLKGAGGLVVQLLPEAADRKSVG